MISKKKILFVSSNRMGWITMANGLREYLTGENYLHLNSQPTARRPLEHLKSLPFLNNIVRDQDRYMKLRAKKLANILKSKSTEGVEHVHCFSHLVAEPEVLASAELSFSVSTDGTWLQSVLDLYGGKALLSDQYYNKRIVAEKAVFNSASAVHCTSEWAQKSVVEDYIVGKEKSFVAPFMIPRLTVPITPFHKRDWLTFIGNDFKRKGGMELLSWHQKYLQSEIELHIVSGIKSPRNLEGMKSVYWHGELPNIEVRNSILPRTKILALPTRVDQSPIVCVEAAQAGIPVIATNIAGIPELVIHHQTGFIIEPNDGDQFADFVKRLLYDKALYTTLSENSIKHASNRLNSKESTKLLITNILSSIDG